jgi:hypothetical protein
MSTKTFFAAYDAAAVYAIGPTPEDAISIAREDAQAPDGKFETAQITRELAAWIDEHGWDGMSESFDLIDGWLIRNRGLDERIESLRDEAGQAGDLAQVAVCERALDGDRRATLECVWALDNAWAANDA